MRLPNQSEPVERAKIVITAPVKDAVGLGDVVKKVTTKMGFKPCDGCNKRAQVLNRWVSFTPRNQ
ncbi:MAG: hypothetical protein QNK37_32825 [Acidobacteriota bacterium]|nr:hypothetical protein [Acidobacteriota bacterium]